MIERSSPFLFLPVAPGSPPSSSEGGSLALTNPTLFFFGSDRRIQAISSISCSAARRRSAYEEHDVTVNVIRLWSDRRLHSMISSFIERPLTMVAKRHVRQ